MVQVFALGTAVPHHTGTHELELAWQFKAMQLLEQQTLYSSMVAHSPPELQMLRDVGQTGTFVRWASALTDIEVL